MLTSNRGLFAATLLAGVALSAAPASAETVDVLNNDEISVINLDRAAEPAPSQKVNYAAGESAFEVTANAALVSEYRFRGVDLSGGDIAIQGGVDVAHSSGFYVGTWGSSLDEDTVGYGHTELDVYGGWSGDVSEGVSVDVGVLAYLYPNAGAGDFDYYEFYGSLGFAMGPAEATVGVAYAPDQDSLGDTDNLYLYTDLGVSIPNTPLSVTGHVGYTDGFLTFTNDGDAFDWSIGLEAAVAGPVSVGVSYVEAEGDYLPGDYNFTDGAAVISLSASF